MKTTLKAVSAALVFLPLTVLWVKKGASYGK